MASGSKPNNYCTYYVKCLPAKYLIGFIILLKLKFVVIPYSRPIELFFCGCFD